eukprot:GHVQ01035193.1.p1 GENE.GHVQ01035193.1~~GHVQ01035193.1.p1  ORF type:complete len:747 (-),score=133.85 GHVQ01035193.1:1012-3228(-)
MGTIPRRSLLYGGCITVCLSLVALSWAAATEVQPGMIVGGGSTEARQLPGEQKIFGSSMHMRKKTAARPPAEPKATHVIGMRFNNEVAKRFRFFQSRSLLLEKQRVSDYLDQQTAGSNKERNMMMDAHLKNMQGSAKQSFVIELVRVSDPAALEKGYLASLQEGYFIEMLQRSSTAVTAESFKTQGSIDFDKFVSIHKSGGVDGPVSQYGLSVDRNTKRFISSYQHLLANEFRRDNIDVLDLPEADKLVLFSSDASDGLPTSEDNNDCGFVRMNKVMLSDAEFMQTFFDGPLIQSSTPEIVIRRVDNHNLSSRYSDAERMGEGMDESMGGGGMGGGGVEQRRPPPLVCNRVVLSGTREMWVSYPVTEKQDVKEQPTHTIAVELDPTAATTKNIIHIQNEIEALEKERYEAYSGGDEAIKVQLKASLDALLDGRFNKHNKGNESYFLALLYVKPSRIEQPDELPISYDEVKDEEKAGPYGRYGMFGPDHPYGHFFGTLAEKHFLAKVTHIVKDVLVHNFGPNAKHPMDRNLSFKGLHSNVVTLKQIVQDTTANEAVLAESVRSFYVGLTEESLATLEKLFQDLAKALAEGGVRIVGRGAFRNADFDVFRRDYLKHLGLDVADPEDNDEAYDKRLFFNDPHSFQAMVSLFHSSGESLPSDIIDENDNVNQSGFTIAKQRYGKLEYHERIKAVSVKRWVPKFPRRKDVFGSQLNDELAVGVSLKRDDDINILFPKLQTITE